MSTVQLPTSWQDRLSMIEALNIDLDRAAALFNVSTREIGVAYDLAKQNIITIKPASDADKARWNLAMGVTVKPAPEPVNVTPEVIESVVTEATQITNAARDVTQIDVSNTEQRRGRPSNKVAIALGELTTDPIPLDEFLTKHNVSETVLRQSKRFVGEPIKVSIRKDKQTGIKMVCRV